MRKYIYITAASICVILGTIGMFLPILPTTPFLLLAIWLFMRSSRRGVKMILSNRYLAPYVHAYFSRNGIPAAKLRRILLTLWLTLLLGMVLCHKVHAVLLLAAVGIGVTIHLYRKREKLT